MTPPPATQTVRIAPPPAPPPPSSVPPIPRPPPSRGRQCAASRAGHKRAGPLPGGLRPGAARAMAGGMQETASGSPAAAATAAPAPPPLPAARRVTAVTVTHDSAGEIGGFLAALPPGMAAVVVDNASADGTAERAEAWAGAARVVRSGRNLGFGAGCNLGLALVETEFALLANPDARPSAEATTALVAAADAFPDAALLAPLILDAAGRPARSWDAEQSRRRRLPRRRDAEPWPEGPVCVEHASGACLLLRRADGLRFDEGFFLYYEDDDL